MFGLLGAKHYGSTRINVKSSELCERSKLKINEISVTESREYHRSQSIIELLDESVGDSFDEIVEDFLFPVFECGNKFGKAFVACWFGF